MPNLKTKEKSQHENVVRFTAGIEMILFVSVAYV